MSDEDEKTTELPLGKEAEANLFKSRSIFIYGGITQELAHKVCAQLAALAAAAHVGAGAELQITEGEPGQLRDPKPGLDGEDEQGVVAATFTLPPDLEEADHTVVGHLITSAVLGSCEVQTLVVHPAHRRRGVATALLAAAAALWDATGDDAAFLEVRASNTPARALYEGSGWAVVGLRPRYYADGEDALVLRKELL